MSELQPATDVLGGSDTWIVQVTLATQHPVGERMLDAMADRGEPQDVTVAARADEPGVVFTAEVPAEQVSQVPGWAFAIAEDAGGYGTPAAPMLNLVELRVMTPQVYEAEATRPAKVS